MKPKPTEFDENGEPESNDEWLQLTEEDIERATRLQRATPSEGDAGVITITSEDVAPAEDDAITTGTPIAITVDDLRPAPSQSQATPSIARLEQLMFHLVNTTRQHHLPGFVGTATLVWHEKLAAVARQHSADMLRRQYVSHVTPERVTVAQRLRYNGISYVACGENIGIVYGTAAHSEQGVHDIHNAFMSQPRKLTNHRGNLLNPIWTHVGIGFAYNPDGSLVVTQNFISAPAKRLRE